MSLLREFEQRLEALFEGFFTRQFKSGIQPVEIAKKLVREMNANRTISVSRLYVPNRYVILLSEADAEKLKPFEKTLIPEFQSFLISHAKKEGYEMLGRPSIEIKSAPTLSLGEILIESVLESREAEAKKPAQGTRVIPPTKERPRASTAGGAYLVKSGEGKETRLTLIDPSTKIGRAADNHIVIPNPNVSRYHAQIDSIAQGAQFVLKDLGSTNGTYVNGMKVREHDLISGDTVAIGTTKFYFRRDAGV